MTIKKQFVELVNLLENNKGKKVSAILNEVKELASSKKIANTVLYDVNKKPVAIYCYYHKQWEVVAEVEYGSKKSSKSGLNTMCKIGVNHWTKQQSVASKLKNETLENVAIGKIKPDELLTRLADIESDRNSISNENKPQGFGTEEEVLDYITSISE